MTTDRPQPLNCEEIEAKVCRARSHMAAICKRLATWRMSIPVQPDDSDVVLSDAIDALEDALRAEWERAKKAETKIQGYDDALRESIADGSAGFAVIWQAIGYDPNSGLEPPRADMALEQAQRRISEMRQAEADLRTARELLLESQRILHTAMSGNAFMARESYNAWQLALEKLPHPLRQEEPR